MSLILKRLDKNYYRFYSENGKVDDKIIEDILFIRLNNYYKLHEDEVDYALDEMIRNHHDTAHFGINGSFIFTELSKKG